MRYYCCPYEAPLVGALTLIASDEGLAAVLMDAEHAEKVWRPDRNGLIELADTGGHPHLCAAAAWLDRYFKGEKPSPGELALAPAGTPSAFRRCVWDVVAEIPFGQTMTYGQVAARVAARQGTGRMSAQAVGNAVAHNLLNIVVPRHRVVSASARGGGYNAGIERKAALLQFEQSPRASGE